jgi:TetR/AcrR family transcriptional regulator, ethionamide resistance regulator
MSTQRSDATAPAKRRRDELILDALERLLATTPMSELDVEPIAAEAGITRTRFYAYFTSKYDALAGLLRRMVVIRGQAFDHPDSWFAGRAPGVRPRDALRQTIQRTTDTAWAHRFVMREGCDLWTAVPEVRAAWLELIDIATTKHERAIVRERAVGIAPGGLDARRLAEALAWQSERLYFRSWAELPGAMSKQELITVTVENYMRMIFVADDPDPEGMATAVGRRKRRS